MACRKRLLTALELLVPEDGDRLIIVGGHRDSGPSEAEIAYGWLNDQRERVWAALAPDCCTARDMAYLARWLRAQGITDRLVIVSHPWHARLAAITLERCGYKTQIVPSEEKASFGRLEYLARLIITAIDPSWSGWLTWPLRLRASRRANGI